MATNYPTGYDTAVTVPATLDGTPLHSVMHDNDRDAIVAMQVALGLSPQAGFSDVAERIARLEERAGSRLVVRTVPSAGVTVAAGWGVLVNQGTVVIPSWSTRGIFTVSLSGLTCTASTTHLLAVSAGVLGTGDAVVTVPGTALTDRRQASFSTQLSGLSAGATVTLAVQAQRADAGSAGIRADTGTLVTTRIEWLP